MLISRIDVHDLNADSPIVLTVDGIVILINDEQPLKLDSLIVVTLSGMMMFSNDEQQ